MVILPFVVFGGVLNNRLKQHPFTTVTQVTRNRFIQGQSNSLADIQHLLRNLRSPNITYGFKCEFDTEKEVGHNIVITFEGDLDKNEYYVIDIA